MYGMIGNIGFKETILYIILSVKKENSKQQMLFKRVYTTFHP
jgi:hypothetical protein